MNAVCVEKQPWHIWFHCCHETWRSRKLSKKRLVRGQWKSKWWLFQGTAATACSQQARAWSTPETNAILVTTSSVHQKKKKRTFCQRFYARWIGEKRKGSDFSSLLLAVMLWYLLGVMSIGTSKLLLMPTKTNQLVGNVPPLYLTLQQLLLGSWFFRLLLNMKAFGSAGVQPWPSKTKSKTKGVTMNKKMTTYWTSNKAPDLVLAGVFFCLGFLSTNCSFHRSSAAFVETVKVSMKRAFIRQCKLTFYSHNVLILWISLQAAEPITSAAVAVSWGIETLGVPEVLSLGTIVMGVLFSTLANESEAHR